MYEVDCESDAKTQFLDVVLVDVVLVDVVFVDVVPVDVVFAHLFPFITTVF